MPEESRQPSPENVSPLLRILRQTIQRSLDVIATADTNSLLQQIPALKHDQPVHPLVIAATKFDEATLSQTIADFEHFQPKLIDASDNHPRNFDLQTVTLAVNSFIANARKLDERLKALPRSPDAVDRKPDMELNKGNLRIWFDNDSSHSLR